MKKIFLLEISLISCAFIFAQDYKMQGNKKEIEGDYTGAAAMYQLCMENDEECTLRYFKLLYEKKIEREFPDQLYRIISPLAQKGNDVAQFYLASMYYDGCDVAKNMKEAANWFVKSAVQGNSNAQVSLGNMYDKGINFSKNRTKAIEWYSKAAEQGNEEAKNRLEVFKATYLRIKPDQIPPFGSAGGISTIITVKTDGHSWDVVNLPSWCSVKQKKSNSFRIECEPNNEGPRACTVFIVSGNIQMYITVEQKAFAPPTKESKAITIYRNPIYIY